jgi:hypothetical protein
MLARCLVRYCAADPRYSRRLADALRQQAASPRDLRGVPVVGAGAKDGQHTAWSEFTRQYAADSDGSTVAEANGTAEMAVLLPRAYARLLDDDARRFDRAATARNEKYRLRVASPATQRRRRR